MFWLGKLLGAVFGYMIAGPYGAIFGLMLGHYFDLSRKGQWAFLLTPRQHTQTQEIFFTTTFTLMGYIAKADGRVSENEIRAATKIMQNMMLTPKLKQEAIYYFQLGKKADFNLDQLLSTLTNACHQQRNLLTLFIEIQLQAAFADGVLSHQKQKILEHICYRLGINPQHFFQQKHFYERTYQSGHHHGQHPQKPSYPNLLENAYRTLGITKEASTHDLKKAYRKLMSQNHPDKLVSRGLPEEMIKLATQKTQEIKSAYELICKARGL